MNILSDTSEERISSPQKHEFNKGWQYLGIWEKKPNSYIPIGSNTKTSMKTSSHLPLFYKMQDPDLDFCRKVLCEAKGIHQQRVSASGPEKTSSLIHSL